MGDYPTAIDIAELFDTVYVANRWLDSISVIDGEDNEVVAGVTFEIEPFNSGYIECNGLKATIPQYFYLYSSTGCIAKPNKGFEFLSWEENLKYNSTQLITVSHPSSTTISDSISDSFENVGKFLGIWDLLGIPHTLEDEAILNVTKFGSFTAKFKELPSPVPPEFWLQSYVLVNTVIAGLSIPSIVGWIKSKMDSRKLNYYHKKIASLYWDDGKT